MGHGSACRHSLGLEGVAYGVAEIEGTAYAALKRILGDYAFLDPDAAFEQGEKLPGVG